MFAKIAKVCALVAVKATTVSHNPHEIVDNRRRGGLDGAIDSSMQQIGNEEKFKKMEREKLTPRFIARSRSRSSPVGKVKGVVVDHDGNVNGSPSVDIIRQGELDKAIDSSFQQIEKEQTATMRWNPLKRRQVSPFRKRLNTALAFARFVCGFFSFVVKSVGSLVEITFDGYQWWSAYQKRRLLNNLKEGIKKMTDQNPADATTASVLTIKALIDKADKDTTVSKQEIRDATDKLEIELMKNPLKAYSDGLAEFMRIDGKGEMKKSFIEAMRLEATEKKKKIKALIVDYPDRQEDIEGMEDLYNLLQTLLKLRLRFIDDDNFKSVETLFEKLKEVESGIKEISTEKDSEGFKDLYDQIREFRAAVIRAENMQDKQKKVKTVTSPDIEGWSEVFAFLEKFAFSRLQEVLVDNFRNYRLTDELKNTKAEDIQVDSEKGFPNGEPAMWLESLDELVDSFFALVEVAKRLQMQGKKFPRRYELKGDRNKGVVLAKVMDLVQTILKNIPKSLPTSPRRLSDVLEKWKEGANTIKATCKRELFTEKPAVQRSGGNS